jgi:hypothetical protein
MPFGVGPWHKQMCLIQGGLTRCRRKTPIGSQKAEAATLAEKQLASARANIPAVEARIAAEKAKLAEPADSQVGLAKKAQEAERQSNCCG